jgi:hypothetical protein
VTKDQIVFKIENARKLHLKWIQRVKHLLEEVCIVDEMIVLNPQESEFGKWLYQDAVKCKEAVFLNDTFKKIEEDHNSLHRKYFEIYRIYFVETKRKSILAKVLGRRKNITHTQRIEAREYYYELIEISKRLLLQINNLDRKVKMSNEEAIEKWLAA